MAVAALPCIVIRRTGVAGLAVGETAVIEGGVLPGGGIVAFTALPRVVTSWRGVT